MVCFHLFSSTNLVNVTTYHRSLSEIRAAIPAHLFVRNTFRGLAYLARDIIMAAITWELATYIDPLCTSPAFKATLGPIGSEVLRWSLWAT